MNPQRTRMEMEPEATKLAEAATDATEAQKKR